MTVRVLALFLSCPYLSCFFTPAFHRFALIVCHLQKNKSLLARLNWLHVPLLFGTAIGAIYGLATWTFNWKTALFAVAYYFFSGLGITAGAYLLRGGDSRRLRCPTQRRPATATATIDSCHSTRCIFALESDALFAGYHRLFAHRAYKATTFTRVLLMFMGSAAVEGSVRWWSRDHRAHHRYDNRLALCSVWFDVCICVAVGSGCSNERYK